MSRWLHGPASLHQVPTELKARWPQRADTGVLGRTKMSFSCRESNRDSFVILPTAQSLIPLSYPSSLSHYPTCSTALLASQQLHSESRKLPRSFLLCSPTLQLVPTPSQIHPFNITSPQQASYHPFCGTKNFYTFVNAPMHATALPHNSFLDFVSLILLGKQCTLLCHSVHYKMPQNINKSANAQRMQHF